MKPTILMLNLLSALLLAGCTTPSPLRGGRATTDPTTSGLRQAITQGANPSAPSRQSQTTIRTRTYSLPTPTPVRADTPFPQFPPVNSSFSSFPSVRSSAPTVPASFPSFPSVKSISPFPQFPPVNSSFSSFPSVKASAPVLLTDREETHAETELGPAQKDTAREIGAKLSSLKGIVWVGLGLFLFGLATIFWAPLRAIIGSLTTSIAITLGGLALMVLPTLIVGNELLIFGGVATLVAAWFLAHRHGHAQGQLAAAAKTQRPETAK